MILYHGTTAARLEAIKAEGLKPRGKRGRTNWREAPSRLDCVYLSNAYPLHFAYAAVDVAKDDEELLVLEVDVDVMNLLPDEDWLEQVSRKQGPAPIDASMKLRTSWYRKRLERFQGHALDSLNGIGNVAHLGPIRPDRIRRYATMKQKAYFELVWQGHDPSITVLNYRFVGDRYRQFVADLFAGKLDAEVHAL